MRYDHIEQYLNYQLVSTLLLMDHTTQHYSKSQTYSLHWWLILFHVLIRMLCVNIENDSYYHCSTILWANFFYIQVEKRRISRNLLKLTTVNGKLLRFHWIKPVSNITSVNSVYAMYKSKDLFYFLNKTFYDLGRLRKYLHSFGTKFFASVTYERSSTIDERLHLPKTSSFNKRNRYITWSRCYSCSHS